MLAHVTDVVFKGNLPYTATDATIQEHFDKIHPSSIRHRVDKVTGQSKGFAFLEFENYDRMKTCLKLYHHVSFDDTKSPPRKLNVELTCVILTYTSEKGLTKEKQRRWWGIEEQISKIKTSVKE